MIFFFVLHLNFNLFMFIFAHLLSLFLFNYFNGNGSIKKIKDHHHHHYCFCFCFCVFKCSFFSLFLVHLCSFLATLPKKFVKFKVARPISLVGCVCVRWGLFIESVSCVEVIASSFGIQNRFIALLSHPAFPSQHAARSATRYENFPKIILIEMFRLSMDLQ